MPLGPELENDRRLPPRTLEDAEQKLRRAAAAFKEHPDAEHLQLVHKQAFRIIAHFPEHSHRAMELLKELLG